MRHLFIILFLLTALQQAFAQKEKAYVKQGNDLYQQKRYKEAADLYNKAVEKKQESVEAQFNLGDAFYKQKKFDKAVEQFNKIAESNKDKGVAARAYHNLGNSFLESKKYQESVDAYKKALLNNPKDEETRYNLVYAMNKLKEQQKGNKGNNNKNKDNKKNQDKDKKDKDQDKKNEDKKDKDKQNKDQQQQQQPDNSKISKEDAQRMLDALNNQEKATQDKLKNKKAGAANRKPEKDW